jgi:hypothetical protein
VAAIGGRRIPAARSSRAARRPGRETEVAERVPFLVRLDPEVLAALRRWANDDLRSLNAEIEFLLRRALIAERRLPTMGREPLPGKNDPAD